MDARKREIARIGKERERESEREIARVRERERERERERKWEREGKRKREKSPPPPPPPDNGVPIWERDPQACCRIIAPKMLLHNKSLQQPYSISQCCWRRAFLVAFLSMLDVALKLNVSKAFRFTSVFDAHSRSRLLLKMLEGTRTHTLSHVCVCM